MNEGTPMVEHTKKVILDLTTVLDTITITQIPEPMTIALLGLGSLFLLRRRK